MNKLNAAIIGCGNIYSLHAHSIANSDNVRLAAVADIDAEKAAAAGERHDCKYYTDYRQILQDKSIDTVHICTPHYLHAPMAIEAMESGKDVLVEKPVAINSNAALEMQKAAERTGRQLGVCFQNRYNPSSVKLKELLESGITGSILGAKAFVTWYRGEEYYNSAAWRGTWDKEGGGVLINQAIHTLDLLLWYLGDITGIAGSSHTHMLKGIIEVEDTAEALLEFANGSRAIFYATNCYVADSSPEIEIRCEKAILQLCNGLSVTYPDGRQEHFSDNDSPSGRKACWGSGHNRLINDFYECLGSGKKFPVDAFEGIKALKIIEAIRQQSHTGRASCSSR